MSRILQAWEIVRATRLRWLILAIFLIGFGTRAGIIAGRRQYQIANDTEAEKVARSIATQGVFGNPYSKPTGPTAHVAPVYPFIIAGLYTVFGTGVGGELAKELFNAALSGALYALIPMAAVRLGLGLAGGLTAGLFGALVPVQSWNETRGGWENVLAAIVLLLLSVAAVKVWEKRTLRNQILFGVGWGVMLLLAPATAPILLYWMVLALIAAARSQEFGWGVWASARVLLVVALVLAPWTIRNYREFGTLTFVRDNLGLELGVSNNDLAVSELTRNDAALNAYHPHRNHHQADLVKEMGEAAYNRMQLKAAVAWIGAHPERFRQLTGQRFLEYWSPTMIRPLQRLLLTALGLVGLTGLILGLMDTRKRLAALLFLGSLVVYPLVYYLVQADPRYPYPLQWVLLLWSHSAIMIAFTKIVLSRRPVTVVAFEREDGDACRLNH